MDHRQHMVLSPICASKMTAVIFTPTSSQQKAKTPRPPISIPRIELCAAVLGLKVTQWVTKHLSISIDKISVFYWVDATIVLSWIRDAIYRWPTFVANRVGMIHSATHINQWHHVSTNENPADVLSRGIASAQLIESKLYWNGPYWLRQAQNTWPVTDWTFLEEQPLEIRVNVAIGIPVLSGVTQSLLCQYSSYTTLRRIVVVLLLPKTHHFTNVIIDHGHFVTLSRHRINPAVCRNWDRLHWRIRFKSIAISWQHHIQRIYRRYYLLSYQSNSS